MKRLLASLLLACGVSNAQTPPIDVFVNCSGGNIAVLIVAHKPGNLMIQIAHDLCGSDV